MLAPQTWIDSRALDESQRSQLGAHYTSKEDIETLVEPVLMDPLRREWKKLKGTLAGDYKKGRGSPDAKKQVNGFLKELRGTVVLDPACGSGNFLYVALQKLLGLEKEVLAWSEQLGFKGGRPQVAVDQLRAIEISKQSRDARRSKASPLSALFSISALFRDLDIS